MLLQNVWSGCVRTKSDPAKLGAILLHRKDQTALGSLPWEEAWGYARGARAGQQSPLLGEMEAEP